MLARVVDLLVLPDSERRGRDPARDRDTCQMWRRARSHQTIEVLAERVVTSDYFCCCAFENGLQKRLVIEIETTRVHVAPLALPRSVLARPLARSACHDAKPDITPKLPRLAEAMRCHHECDDLRSSHIAEPGNGLEPLHLGTLLPFRLQPVLHLLVGRCRRIDLLRQPLRARSVCGRYLAQPFRASLRVVDARVQV